MNVSSSFCPLDMKTAGLRNFGCDFHSNAEQFLLVRALFVDFKYIGRQIDVEVSVF